MSDQPSNLDSLFLAALAIESSAERAEFLTRSCGPDRSLRQEVERLLASHRAAGSFLEDPAPELVAAVRKTPSSGGHSVLETLGQTIEIPRVMLRESVSHGSEPIVRPKSPELPEWNANHRYQLQGEIARGGVGAILKGRDTDLGRELAIKVLLDEHKARPEVIQRFIEEAQIGGQLQHPGIAPVYELGQFADRRPFFSMKLVKGETLAKLLTTRQDAKHDRGKFLGIFEQVCQTMAYAHSRGVIHRDLKPANIMVGAFGEVQVMDWGLAKVLPAGGIADEKKSRQLPPGQSVIQTLRSGVGSDASERFGTFGSQTQMGSVMGTPAYMPPEQALGEVELLDERADVFGLGAILCEILTGQPPYVATDGAQIFRLAARGKLDDCFARLAACGADDELIALAKHCLAPEPTDRPRDAGIVAERVKEYLESIEAKVRLAELAQVEARAKAVEEIKRRRLTMVLAATLLLAVTLGGGGWLYLERQRAERQAFAVARVNESLNQARLHQGLADAAAAESVPNLELQVHELDQAVGDAQVATNLAMRENVEQALRRTSEVLLAELQQRAEAAKRRATQVASDREFQNELEEIRLRQAEGGTNFNMPSAHSRYKAAFQKRGLDVLALDHDEAVRRIRESAIRESLIAALDNWTRAVWPGRDSVAWTSLAPALFVAGDDATYAAYCRQMVRDFGDTKNFYEGEQTCKACLLRPGAIELETLPDKVFNEALDQGTAPYEFRCWGWTTRGLLAYRRGEPQAALDYVGQSERLAVHPINHALNLAVTALAQHRLQQTDEARQTLDESLRFVPQVVRDEALKGMNQNLPIACILLREAATLVGHPTVRVAFADILDVREMADATEGFRSRESLARIVQAADSNELRKELRGALTAGNLALLKQFALSQETHVLAPEVSSWLGATLRESGARDEARIILGVVR